MDEILARSGIFQGVDSEAAEALAEPEAPEPTDPVNEAAPANSAPSLVSKLTSW